MRVDDVLQLCDLLLHFPVHMCLLFRAIQVLTMSVIPIIPLPQGTCDRYRPDARGLLRLNLSAAAGQRMLFAKEPEDYSGCAVDTHLPITTHRREASDVQVDRTTVWSFSVSGTEFSTSEL